MHQVSTFKPFHGQFAEKVCRVLGVAQLKELNQKPIEFCGAYGITSTITTVKHITTDRNFEEIRFSLMNPTDMVQLSTNPEEECLMVSSQGGVMTIDRGMIYVGYDGKLLCGPNGKLWLPPR